MKSKNIIKFFSIVALSSLCFSCDNIDKELESKAIIYKKEGINTTISVTTSEQLDDIVKYQDAVLYISQNGCDHCIATRPYLNQFIKETEYVIYEVNIDILRLSLNNDEIDKEQSTLYELPSGTPTFFVYKDQKILNKHEGEIKSVKTIENIFNEYVLDVNYYMLNDVIYEESVDKTYMAQSFDYANNVKTKVENEMATENEKKLYNENTEAYKQLMNKDYISLSDTDLQSKAIESGNIIAFTWKRCKDCKNYKNMVLNNFLAKYTKKRVYFYDTDGFALAKRDSDDKLAKLGCTLYSAFCDKYHLNDYSTIDKYNNKTGFVPTILSTFKSDKKNYSISVFANQLNPKLDSSNKLYYSKAFYPQLTRITSKTQVKKLDPLEDDYQKALIELNELVIKEDAKLNTKYLESLLSSNDVL